MSYTHLTRHDRYVLNHLHMAGKAMTEIGQKPGRSKGTISRELQRNSIAASDGFLNHHASAKAKARRAAPLLPYKLCDGPLTLTADNGKEFAEFVKLEKGLGLKVYFANPHAPWERGTNENTNGLIREYFPEGTDFRKITKSQVDNMVRSMNNRPRKCLGYQTPRQVFEKLAGVAIQI